jgi:ABC-type branched-subunit amino acid transport system ATPase component
MYRKCHGGSACQKQVRVLGSSDPSTMDGPGRKKHVDKAMEILSFVGIEELAYRKSSELPFGWQRLLEIARALASNPKLLLLDEPAAGLNATETRQLGNF